MEEKFKFAQDGEVFHFEERYNMKLKKELYVHPLKIEKMIGKRKRVEFDDFSLRQLRLPDVDLIKKYVASKYDINSPLDIIEATHRKVAKL